MCCWQPCSIVFFCMFVLLQVISAVTSTNLYYPVWQWMCLPRLNLRGSFKQWGMETADLYSRWLENSSLWETTEYICKQMWVVIIFQIDPLQVKALWQFIYLNWCPMPVELPTPLLHTSLYCCSKNPLVLSCILHILPGAHAVIPKAAPLILLSLLATPS